MAIDPSLRAAGYAVVSSVGVVLSAGLIRPGNGEIGQRIKNLTQDIRVLMVEHRPEAVVVEVPQSAGGANRGGYRGHSVMSAPIYGMAVGAAVTVLQECECRLILCQPSEWVGRGRVPSSRNDPNKHKRINYVNRVFNLKLALNSVNGNIADAILMADWGRKK